MKPNPQNFIVCPNLIIEKDRKVLLLRRADWAPLFPGHWHCVTGKIEEGEYPKQAIKREAYEEVGLHIDPILKTVVSVIAKNFQDPALIWCDLSFFFVVNNLDVEPVNKEPRLHDAMEWFPIDHLPQPMIPVVEYGIQCYALDQSYAEFHNV